MSNKSPGDFSRLEPATGLLLRRIAVNGHYLFTDNCTVAQKQKIEPKWFVQGGPNVAISEFGEKHIEGEISFPLLVDGTGTIDPAVQAILDNAHKPISTITLDTNHLISHLGITAEDGGTDNNELLTIDNLVIKKLTLRTSPQEAVKVPASVYGTIETRSPSQTISEPSTGMLADQVEFAGCMISRLQSLMRSTVSLEVTIDNTLVSEAFLIPNGPSTNFQSNVRTDQISAFALSTVRWGGSYEEITRLGASTEDFMHGGWMVGENLAVNFGPVTALFPIPTFQITTTQLTPKLIKRKSEYYGTFSPKLDATHGGLFTYNTEP